MTLYTTLSKLTHSLQRVLDISVRLEPEEDGERITAELRRRRELVNECEGLLKEITTSHPDWKRHIAEDPAIKNAYAHCRDLYARIETKESSLISKMMQSSRALSKKMKKVSSHGKAALSYTRQSQLRTHRG